MSRAEKERRRRHRNERKRGHRDIRMNFQRNPHYLFARVNFADLCLRRGEVERVAQTLQYKFDLKLLYPHRGVFHVTEFVAFSAVVIEYYLQRGELELADLMLDTLEQVAPITSRRASCAAACVLCSSASRGSCGGLLPHPPGEPSLCPP